MPWFLNTWVISASDCRLVAAAMASVYIVCVHILSCYATGWPLLPKCMHLTLVSWYVASMWHVAIVGCSVWVMLCRCEVIPFKVWVLCQCGRAYLCAAQLICIYRSMFLHEIGGILWLTLWRCWLHSIVKCSFYSNVQFTSWIWVSA